VVDMFVYIEKMISDALAYAMPAQSASSLLVSGPVFSNISRGSALSFCDYNVYRTTCSSF